MKNKIIGYLTDPMTGDETGVENLSNLDDGAYIVQNYKKIMSERTVKKLCASGRVVYSLNTYSGNHGREPDLFFTGKIVWQMHNRSPVGCGCFFGKVPAGTLVAAFADD